VRERHHHVPDPPLLPSAFSGWWGGGLQLDEDVLSMTEERTQCQHLFTGHDPATKKYHAKPAQGTCITFHIFLLEAPQM